MVNKAMGRHHKKSWFHRTLSWFLVRPWFRLSLNELLTLVIAALGFIYIVKSLNSTERAVSTGTYLQTYGWTLESDKLMVENPELRSYFFDGKKDTATGNDSIKIKAMAEYLLDNFDAVLNNQSYFTTDTATGNAWKRTVIYFFQHSPALKKRFESERDRNLYGDTLTSLYDKAFPKRN